MDKEMPCMDGYEATRLIRAAGFTKPIIGVTANAFAQDIDVFIAQGVTGVVTKPVDMDQLIALLRQHV
jgi:CheY-like chemotaxis protein